jgi:hypothetical protein
VRAILESSLRTLGLLTYQGDSIARHNVNSEPMLSPFVSAFFILGVLLTVLNIKKPYALFFLSYLFLTLLPGMLTVNAPHAARTLGAVIPAILLTTLGILAAFHILQRVSKTVATTTLAAAILGGSLYTGFNDGLLRYGAALDTITVAESALWGMDREKVHVANLVNELGPKLDIYLSPQLFFHSTIEYLTYSKSAYRFYTSKTDFKQVTPPGKIPVIILQPEETNLWWLRDEEGKHFFKWWDQTYKMDEQKIRLMLRQTYGSAPQMISMSDSRLILHLRELYPNATELRFEDFVIFIIARPS